MIVIKYQTYDWKKQQYLLVLKSLRKKSNFFQNFNIFNLIIINQKTQFKN